MWLEDPAGIRGHPHVPTPQRRKGLFSRRFTPCHPGRETGWALVGTPCRGGRGGLPARGWDGGRRGVAGPCHYQEGQPGSCWQKHQKCRPSVNPVVRLLPTQSLSSLGGSGRSVAFGRGVAGRDWLQLSTRGPTPRLSPGSRASGWAQAWGLGNGDRAYEGSALLCTPTPPTRPALLKVGPSNGPNPPSAAFSGLSL